MVYEKSPFIELKSMGLVVEKQSRIKVYYEGQEVGDYFADLIVDDRVVIELKAAEGLCEDHDAN